jgi:hypothetical protein
MLTLRLTQSSIGPDQYRAELALEGDGPARQTATADFTFQLTAQDQEDLRWYLEDYLQTPHDPAPTIAARIEAQMVALGRQLFQQVFDATAGTQRLWARLYDRLDATRVEIVTGLQEATAIPWELLRDPLTDVPLALRAAAFVRSHSEPVQPPKIPRSKSGPIRILLVLCRPGGGDDVPFRSVASRLLKGLSDHARELFQLDVLRPPTLERLSEVLHAAQAARTPYHVVHFDGHGVFLDLQKLFEQVKDKSDDEPLKLLAELVQYDPQRLVLEVIYPRPLREGTRGYVAFENPHSEHNLRLVDGPELGQLLVETGVPVLVLNACRSAHAEAPEKPEAVGGDPHTQVRAYGSLAQEVMDAGVAGVVAMRYNVYVVTAAQFVADLYGWLSQGHSLGEAVTLGRKQLYHQPVREIGYDPRPLQDWPVPVVYEAAPIAPFPKQAGTPALTITLKDTEAASTRGNLDPNLPKRPDAGFFGRDETLLALDRAFDRQAIVLLHAYAGSGKTSTAAEFARWYALTGGVEGPVLFTSFEQHKPLARVLDQIGQMFGQA